MFEFRKQILHFFSKTYLWDNVWQKVVKNTLKFLISYSGKTVVVFRHGM